MPSGGSSFSLRSSNPLVRSCGRATGRRREPGSCRTSTPSGAGFPGPSPPAACSASFCLSPPTDGTDSGTSLIYDIYPGPGSSVPLFGANVGTSFFFSALEPDHGYEIWRTDATPQGTALFADVLAGPGSSRPFFIREFAGNLFFSAEDGSHGQELWATGIAVPGAIVTYHVAATDDFDPSPTVLCNPPSGSTFPLDTTLVTCTAKDSAGNTAMASFKVTVVSVSISGLSDVEFNTDAQGNTIITGVDAAGDIMVIVVLPPGTTVPSGSLAMDLVISGQNNVFEITGVAVPYPPGKTVGFRVNPGSQFVCIVDRPDRVLLTGLPNCSSTDVSVSQVVIPCDGVTLSFSGFPDAPTSRAYACTPVTIDGFTFFTVTGLAFSLVVAGSVTGGAADGRPATPPVWVFGVVAVFVAIILAALLVRRRKQRSL